MHADKQWMQRINLHAAPQNCFGFSKYWKYLRIWLGTCAWNAVQFNIGAHVGGNGTGSLAAYARDLKHVIEEIRRHSPQARVIVAATTPSPWDSAATQPRREECSPAHAYDRLHVAGAVPQLNQVAQQVASNLSAVYNDRYAVVYGNLSNLQRPCDIHFQEQGYRLLAANDWRVIAATVGVVRRTPSRAGEDRLEGLRHT
eukprot:CAMPEP_0119334694 /NCGR_PEP_ID=MMETSP1333-20130426/87846_1 /TAXON_ID=418940 /ORGANISM="Scyphosphaera apsteinii, Strain RCC1455" /LENGTH=199 /DNA_ID=CAMNT_0007345049 /DNA_START=69 /DNA_END=665 /DNA_ORIENTATION=-